MDGHRNVGLFEDFRGYRVPDGDEMAGALRTALVVIDTNVLLNLYRYHETARHDLLALLERLGDRLWLPHQVVREFWRNRLSVIAGRDTGSEQALAALSKQRLAAIDTVQTWARSTAVDASLRDELVGRIETLYGDLETTVQDRTPDEVEITGGAMDEPVIRRLEELVQGRVGPCPDAAEWQAQVDEGRARVARQEPPGYLDAAKAESSLPEGPAGDYLVWRQSVDEARRRGTNLLIVTGDEKGDWWWRYRADFLGPRQELVAEFARTCDGAQLYMMRPADLLRAAVALDVAVSNETVDEVDRVSQDSVRPPWSPEGVAALLDGLEAEGWEHAQVIRVAAERGGRIDRDDIYDVCGYDGDRMLRGFTRPAARITRDLQDRGVVAAGVEAALTPIYAGGVKAVAFRIPPEIVPILAAIDHDPDGFGDPV